jgi:hypothetical protein
MPEKISTDFGVGSLSEREKPFISWRCVQHIDLEPRPQLTSAREIAIGTTKKTGPFGPVF